MYRYFIKTPWVIKHLFSSYLWSIRATEKEVYLTFDDGPHPQVTPLVLQQLKQYNAQSTFFCIGKNVLLYPGIYKQILADGHSVGNHSFNHLNGWVTDSDSYMADIEKASKIIPSNLFRPPYGKIKPKQARIIGKAINHSHPQIVMWDVLSGDFDVSITKEECLNNVIKNYTPGSIIVFHDSEKASKNLNYVLPMVLEKLSNEGYIFKKIEMDIL
jgi:peptidoglycan/xylan/chitin deacetylase (PgdA/CDA1 family)